MPSRRPDKDANPNRLMVEGEDDLHTVVGVTRALGVRWSASDARVPFAPELRGWQHVLHASALAIKTRNHPCVAIVLDADDDPVNRWTEVRAALRSEISLPLLPVTGGGCWTTADGEVTVGVWLMPDNASPGTLETFLARLMPDGDPLWGHATQSTTKAREHGAQFRARDHDKARVRAWLAWQREPGPPYGRAVSMGYVPTGHPLAAELVQWFLQVFDRSGAGPGTADPLA